MLYFIAAGLNLLFCNYLRARNLSPSHGGNFYSMGFQTHKY